MLPKRKAQRSAGRLIGELRSATAAFAFAVALALSLAGWLTRNADSDIRLDKKAKGFVGLSADFSADGGLSGTLVRVEPLPKYSWVVGQTSV